MNRGDDIAVLYVGSSPVTASDVAASITVEAEELSVTPVADADTAATALSGGRVDCVVTDPEFLTAADTELLELLREHNSQTPVVLFGEHPTEPNEDESIAATVTDYVQDVGGGEQYPVLANRIRQAVTRMANTGQNEQEQEPPRNAPQELFHAINDAVYVHAPDGSFLAVNERACKRLGYSETELFEMRPADIHTPEHAEFTANRIEAIESQGTDTFETVHVTKHGEHIPVEVAASAIEYDGDPAILSVARDISEQKRRTEQLRRYKDAIDSSTDILVAADATRRILFANERFQEVFGTDGEDPAGTQLSEYLDPEEYAEVGQYIDRGLGGDSGRLQRSHRRPDGEERTLSVNYYPLEGADGTVDGVVASLRDITEQQKKLDEVHRLSEYRRVMSAVNQQLVDSRAPTPVLRQIASIIASSEQFTRAIIHRPDADLIEASAASPEAGQERPRRDFETQAYLDAVFEAGTFPMETVTEPPFQQRPRDDAAAAGFGFALRHEGERFGALTVHLPPGKPASGDLLELLEELVDDIGLFLYTRKIEADLGERGERLELALEGAELGVWDWDMETDEVYRDERYARMLGYDPESFGDDVEAWAEILHPDARETHDEALANHLEGEAELYRCEYRLRTNDDEWKWIRNIGKVLEWADGTPVRAVGVHQDIDDQRRTRERLRSNNELLQVIDRVLRHNLNNKMSVIQGYAETIAAAADGRIEAQAEQILESGRSLLETTDKERRIMNLVAEPQATERLALGPMLRRIRSRVRDRYPEALIQLPDTETAVLAKPSLEGALEEVIENGIVHGEQAAPAVAVRVQSEPEAVTVTVTDDGPGLPKMERNVLTGQDEITPLYHGSGLGLWLINLVVRRSDGQITVAEPAAGGTRVTIELPVAI